MSKPKKTQTIDARGMLCPRPLLELKQAMNKLPARESVEIWVTDVHAELDFEIWCERFGHQISKLKPNNEAELRFEVTKSEA